ncbi:MAG: hypothetical protein UHD09_04630 [Bifidobacterium sp.]|nr:hypothetical protein [Bifidobacterium sp.]
MGAMWQVRETEVGDGVVDAIVDPDGVTMFTVGTDGTPARVWAGNRPESVRDAAHAIWDFLSADALVTLDMQDLMAVADGKEMRLVEESASGPGRAGRIGDALAASVASLAAGGHVAQNALVSLTGPDDLSMTEAHRIVGSLRGALPGIGVVIWGLDLVDDPSLPVTATALLAGER